MLKSLKQRLKYQVLVTNAELTAVENKIPNISSLVKKTDYVTKITKIQKKLIDHNYDKDNQDFDAKLSSLSRKISANELNHLLVENELKKLKTFDSIYFRGKGHFEEDGMQNYSVFQPIKKYFKKFVGVGNGRYIY